MKPIKFLARFAFVLLLLVFALNNLQKVEFNLLGIYIWHLPLIIILLITLILGAIIGYSIWLITLTQLKLEIHRLKKQLEKSRNKNL